MSKKVRVRLKVHILLLIAGLLVLICVCLTGCIPDEFTKEEARAQEKTAMDIFAQYLEGELGGGEIEEVSVHKVVLPKDYEYGLTDFVDGRFIYKGESYAFVVNTRTEEIFTSLRVEELKEMGINYVLDYFQISCEEIIESHINVNLMIPAVGEDKEKKFDGMETLLTDVVPVSLDVSKDSIRTVLEDEAYTVSMEIIYKGKDGPEPDGYGIEALPGLKFLNIKHMKSKAEASDELLGIYDYMMSEILKESNRNDSHTTRYARWDHLEKEGFHLFFETYCRECIYGDVVETELEKGRDIKLLVENEWVEVDCHSDIYYFLFAKDLSDKEFKGPVAREYISGSGNRRFDKLKWLRDGKRFVVGIWREPNSFQGWSVFYFGDEAKKRLKDYGWN